ERAGSYLNWEGRERAFRTTLDGSGSLPDCRVLDTLAVEMDVDLFTQTPAAAAGELARLGVAFSSAPAPAALTLSAPVPGRGEAVLATWRALLDHGALQSGELALAGTARERCARVHPDTAVRLGVVDDQVVAVATAAGAVTATLRVDAGVLVDVLWLPAGPDTTGPLAAGQGALVTVTGGAQL
ncbi:MAG: molybdopterin dinucleotide binding domain-containing protein, partial [Mycobacteriaceae bacterium]